MATENQNFTINAGDSRAVNFELTMTGTLEGAYIKWVLAKGGIPVITKDTVNGITITGDKTFSVTLLGSDTTGLDGTYLQEVDVTELSGNKSTVSRGEVVVIAEYQVVNAIPLRNIMHEATLISGIPTVSDRDFLIFYNSGVNRLAILYDTAKRREKQVIVCDDTTKEYSLINGCIGIERCLTENKSRYRHFLVRGNSKVLFPNEGTYEMHLCFMPTAITNIDSYINVPPVYKEAIKDYVAAMLCRSTNKELSNDFLNLFSNDASMANNAIRKADNPSKQIVARRWV